MSTESTTPRAPLLLLIAICIVQLGAVLWVQAKRGRVRVRERAAQFGDERFATLFDGTPDAQAKLAKLIARPRSAEGHTGPSREVTP